jgi:hypothetical protein
MVCSNLQYGGPDLCALQDPRFIVGYYHNKVTAASAYDKPGDYATWEAAHQDYVRKVVK